jgi:hypothetical protein
MISIAWGIILMAFSPELALASNLYHGTVAGSLILSAALMVKNDILGSAQAPPRVINTTHGQPKCATMNRPGREESSGPNPRRQLELKVYNNDNKGGKTNENFKRPA